jgi:hypothetical protein
MTALRAIGFVVLDAATMVGTPLSVDESRRVVEVDEDGGTEVVVEGVSKPDSVLSV